MVFPALIRLESETGVSKCKAGLVRARLRFMVAEQEALVTELNEASGIAGRYLSPAGPCEFCHELLGALAALSVKLTHHLALEQEELFTWALQREDRLIANLSSADERCL